MLTKNVWFKLHDDPNSNQAPTSKLQEVQSSWIFDFRPQHPSNIPKVSYSKYPLLLFHPWHFRKWCHTSSKVLLVSKNITHQKKHTHQFRFRFRLSLVSLQQRKLQLVPSMSKWNNFRRFKNNKTANASGHWLNLLDLVTRCPFRPTVSGPVVLWDTKLCWVGRGWQVWRGVCLEAGDFPFRFWPDLMPQKLEVTYTVDPFLKRGRGTQHPTGRSPHKGHHRRIARKLFVSFVWGIFLQLHSGKFWRKSGWKIRVANSQCRWWRSHVLVP